jgi:hypothetical protein
MNQYTDAIGFFGTFIFFFVFTFLLIKTKYWGSSNNVLKNLCYYSVIYPLITGILYSFLPRKIIGEITLATYLAPFYFTVMTTCVYGLCLIGILKIAMYFENRNKQ